MGSCRISIRKIILPLLAAVMLLLAFAPVSGSALHTAKAAETTVAEVGKTGFVTADMVKEGAVVIDVGINRVDGKVCGDVDFEHVKEKASWITPVPGGVGKMTITMLLDNTVEAAERNLNRDR